MLMYGTDVKVDVHYSGQRGTGVYPVTFEGLIENVERRYRETFSESSKAQYEEFMRITPCSACGGQRLKKESLAVTIGDKNIYEVTCMPISELGKFLAELKLTPVGFIINNAPTNAITTAKLCHIFTFSRKIINENIMAKNRESLFSIEASARTRWSI